METKVITKDERIGADMQRAVQELSTRLMGAIAMADGFYYEDHVIALNNSFSEHIGDFMNRFNEEIAGNCNGENEFDREEFDGLLDAAIRGSMYEVKDDDPDASRADKWRDERVQEFA